MCLWVGHKLYHPWISLFQEFLLFMNADYSTLRCTQRVCYNAHHVFVFLHLNLEHLCYCCLYFQHIIQDDYFLLEQLFVKLKLRRWSKCVKFVKGHTVPSFHTRSNIASTRHISRQVSMSGCCRNGWGCWSSTRSIPRTTSGGWQH